jgi:hypothetical protein
METNSWRKFQTLDPIVSADGSIVVLSVRKESMIAKNPPPLAADSGSRENPD